MTKADRDISGPVSFIARIKTVVRQAYTVNQRTKLVALLLALTVFVLVNTDNENLIGVQVGLSIQIPPGQVLVEEAPRDIRLSVKGRWRRLRQFDERQLPRLQVDLRESSSGNYTVKKESFRLPEGLRIVSIDPPTLYVRYEKKTEKTVPISVTTSGVLPPGYRVSSIVSTPKEAVISGGESIVSSITQISATDLVLTDKIKSYRTFSVLAPAQPFVAVSPERVTVQVNIEQESVKRSYPKVLVSIVDGNGSDMGKARANPKYVSVTASGSQLAIDRLPKTLSAVVAYPDSLQTTSKPAPLAVKIEEDTKKNHEDVQFDIIPNVVSVTMQRR